MCGLHDFIEAPCQNCGIIVALVGKSHQLPGGEDGRPIGKFEIVAGAEGFEHPS